MKLNESAENYLETILVLTRQNGYVRGIDIANELSFSKPSVSIAMKSLRENNYITIEQNGGIVLTPLGLEAAEHVYDRHQVIAAALMSLGVDEKTAFDDSCKIEHYISEKSFTKIKEYLESQKPTPSRSGDIDVVLL